MSISDGIISFVSRELLSEQGAPSIGGGDDLLGSGLVDSIGVTRLIAHIEQSYGVAVPPGDVTIENFMTVDAITSYLGTRGVTHGSDPTG